MALNIKQTSIMEFLTDKFNENSFDIPFKQGFYTNKGQDDINIIFYKPKLSDNGLFDIEDTFNSETYAIGKNRFIVMQTDVSSGEYVGLPNVQMVSYNSNIEVMVYADDPLILIATKMAIEEIRDSFIGTMHTYKIKEQNESSIDDATLKIVTNAGGIDYGSEIIVKGRKFLMMSFNVDMSVSKNVDFGNQVEYKVCKHHDDGTEGTYYDVIPLISSWGVSQDMTSEQTLNSLNPTIADKAKEIHNYVKSRGWGMTFTFLKTSDKIIRDMYIESIKTPDKPPIYSVKMKQFEINDGSVIFLGNFDNITEVPNDAIVGSLFYIDNELFMKTASGFTTNTPYDSIEKNGEVLYRKDLSFKKRCVYGEAQPADIVRGEPIIFSIGFVVSSK